MFAVVLLASLVAAALPTLPRQNPPVEPPEELVSLNLWTGIGMPIRSSDVKLTSLDWNTLTKTVLVHRRERNTPSDPWLVQDQELSASFYIIDVTSRCDQHLYVTGVYDSGTTTIERWSFLYRQANLPLPVRSPPGVARSVVYSGTDLGHISGISVDPSGRYLFILTWESHSLYRIDLPSGTPTLVYSPSTLPDLSTMGTVSVQQHATEGRKCTILQGYRWNHVFPVTTPVKMIILADPENDGTFQSPEVLTTDQWTARGYDQSANWVSFATLCN